MTVYIAGRQTGKTSRLVRESAITGAIIVVPTYQMAEHTLWTAKQLNLKIPEPITVTDYIYRLAKGGLGKTQKYLIDELQMMLCQMNVETATLNPKSTITVDYSVEGFQKFLEGLIDFKNTKKGECDMFGVKETCCTKCGHRDVCQYKEEYLAAQAAVDEVSVNLPSKGDKPVKSIRLRDIPWIEPTELKCRYFHQSTGTVR
jgi:hypothetical protein